MLALVLASVCGCAALLPPGMAAPADSRTHFVFLMADQMRSDVLGVMGNTHNVTPNLDKLAADGLLMRHGFSSTPTCTPARAALLTGQSPWNHGMLGYGTVAPHYPFAMPKTMASYGYSTASFGKDHFGWNTSTNEGIAHGYERITLYDGLGGGKPSANGTNGYDDYDQWFQTQLPGKDPEGTGLDWNTWHGKTYIYPEYTHPTAWVGRNAVDYVTNYSDPRPMFMKVSFHRPHSPYDPPPRVYDRFSALSLPDPAMGDEWDSMFRTSKACGPTYVDAWCGFMPEAESIISRRSYLASAAFVDEWLGHIIDALKIKNMYDNAFIMFVADHGDMQGDHYHWRKGFPYEGSAHVPYLVRWPTSMDGAATVARGSTSELVSELRDVFPTALAVAGVLTTTGELGPAVHPEDKEHIAKLDGKPLTCLLVDPTGAACHWREWVDLEHNICYNETNHWNALTDGKIKYIFNAFFPQEQLFNLTADPTELHDLAADSSFLDTLELWRQRLVTLFEDQNRGPGWVQGGKLMQRTEGQNYSPNYPRPTPVVGSPVVLAQCSATKSGSNQLWTVNTTLSLCIKGAPGAAVGGEMKCLQPFQLCAASQGDGSVQLAACASTEAAQHFAFDHGTGHLAQGSQCLAGHGATVKLAACATGDAAQKWVLGMSGKLYLSTTHGACLTGQPNNLANRVVPPVWP